MNRDRLATVIHLRELAERKRLAEQARAERTRVAAVLELQTAVETHRDAVPAAGAQVRPGDLVAHRIGVVALEEVVEGATERSVQAHRAAQLAGQALMTAAIERRSVERLHERRTEQVRTQAARRQQTRDDETALQRWRRTR